MIIATTYPVARKPHRCEACPATIAPGKRYIRHAGATDGHAWAVALCEACDRLNSEAWDIVRADGIHEDDGPTFRGLLAWVQDDVDRLTPESAEHARRAFAAVKRG